LDAVRPEVTKEAELFSARALKRGKKGRVIRKNGSR